MSNKRKGFFGGIFLKDENAFVQDLMNALRIEKIKEEIRQIVQNNLFRIPG